MADHMSSLREDHQRLAVLVMAHTNPALVADSVAAIRTWMSEDILVLVDEIGWPKFERQNDLGAPLLKGFYHYSDRSPYRNYLLGLQHLYERYPGRNWYCYLEYDVLVLNSGFRIDLPKLERNQVWMAGHDLRRYPYDYALIGDVLGKDVVDSWYLLGCVHLLHRCFLEKLADLNLFQTLLDATKSYERGYFPEYKRYAFEEELLPTVAVALGGRLHELACWQEDSESWRGSSFYRCRFRPPIRAEEIPPAASLVHPVRLLDHPLRVHSRQLRHRLVGLGKVGPQAFEA